MREHRFLRPCFTRCLILGVLILSGSACGSSEVAVPANWFTDLFVKPKSELEAAKSVTDQGVKLPQDSPFESLSPYFDQKGRLAWLSATIPNPPGDLRLAISEFGVKPGNSTPTQNGGFYVARFVGLPAEWQAFVRPIGRFDLPPGVQTDAQPPRSVDFFSTQVAAKMDRQNTDVTSKLAANTFSNWTYATWGGVLKWLGRPMSIEPSVADVFHCTYGLKGKIESIGFGLRFSALLEEVDPERARLEWVYVTFAKSVTTPEQAFAALGVGRAKAGAKENPNSFNSALLVTGSGLPSATISQQQGQWSFRFVPRGG